MREHTLPNVSTNVAPKRNYAFAKRILRKGAPILTLALVLGAWQVIAVSGIYPEFIIPAPMTVAEKFSQALLDGRLWFHTQATLTAVLAALLLGSLSGLTLGYVIAKQPLLEDLISPIVVAFQATPVVAYAPLLVIWFGSGPESKIVTGTLIVFFPMLMNTLVGIRSVPQGLRDVMRASRASRWQTFTKLEIPAAMPVLVSGLKMSATLAVIGAVVGEFVAARAGLGFLIVTARGTFDTALVLVAVFTLTALALSLYALVGIFAHYALGWQRRANRSR
ncbi:MAG: ABC transporter permease [Anaerolineae bacterium]